ncbi:MAG: hypothetical protein ABJB09_07370 [Verrucomicrobiota bacterium]
MHRASWWRVKNHTIQNTERIGYSPAQFARACEKHPSWAYRALYSGKIKAVTSLGRLLIPASEVERIMATAETYNPKPKKRKAEKAAGKEMADAAS